MRNVASAGCTVVAWCLLIGGASFAQTTAEQESSQVPSTSSEFLVRADSGAKRSASSGKASIEILSEGKEAFLGKLRLAPGAKVPLHRDESEEHIHVLKGSGLLFLNGTKFRIQTGDTIRMPAGAEVRFENGPDEMIVLQVFAGPTSAQKYKTWVETRE